MNLLQREYKIICKTFIGSGGIRTHASEETGALNQRLRPLGHATCEMAFPRGMVVQLLVLSFRRRLLWNFIVSLAYLYHIYICTYCSF